MKERSLAPGNPRPPHAILTALAYAGAHHLHLGSELMKKLGMKPVPSGVEFASELALILSVFIIVLHGIPILLNWNIAILETTLSVFRFGKKWIDRFFDYVREAIDNFFEYLRRLCIAFVKRLLAMLQGDERQDR